jgi:hypothetical protein
VPFSLFKTLISWLVTGINDPDIILVIDKGEEYLIVPKRNQSRELLRAKLIAVDFRDMQAFSQYMKKKKVGVSWNLA